MTTHFNPFNDPFTHRLIKRKANRLRVNAGFTHEDSEDLKQNLYIHVLENMASFDANRAPRDAYITTLVSRFVANVLRDRRAAKRDSRSVGSLNVMVANGEAGPIELAQIISFDINESRHRQYRRSEEDLMSLQMDLSSILVNLPAESLSIIRLLKTMSTSEAARKLNVPRTTLRKKIGLIRQRFASAGLRDYLN